MPVKIRCVLLAAFVACCLFLVGCDGVEMVSGGESIGLDAYLETATVTVEDIDYTATTAGALVPARLTELRFETASGPLLQLHVNAFDVISKGDPVAELGMENYDETLAVAEIEAQKWLLKNELQEITLREAEIDQRQAEIALQTARNRRVAAIDIERAENAYESARNQYEMAKINRELNALDYAAFIKNYETLKAACADYQLTSPYDGVVASVEKVRLGDQINAGKTIAKIIENRYAVLEIKSNEALSLANQTDVHMEINGEPFAGTVYTPEEGDDISQTALQNGIVYIAFSEKIPAVTPFKTTAVTINIQKTAALVIDKNCIRTVNGLPSVERLVGDRYVETPVVCGVESGRKIEIISGLNEGDVVLAE